MFLVISSNQHKEKIDKRVNIIYMLLNNLPIDLVVNITKYLPYQKCILLKYIFKDPLLSYKWLFMNSSFFYDSKYITNFDVYELLKSSSFKFKETYNILNDLNKNIITTDNKFNYYLTYNKTNNIKSTTRIVQIILQLNELYIKNSMQIINNPHYYIHILITDTVINYYTDLICKTYDINENIQKYSFKFRLKCYDSIWYKHDINLYLIYLLYLSNLDILNVEYDDELFYGKGFCQKCMHIVFEYIELFNINKSLMILFTKLYKYILQNNVKLNKIDYSLISNLYYELSNLDSKYLSDEFEEFLIYNK
jgi:hypothetical protein